MSSYRHDQILVNAAGLPIFQQHGSIDDNVPAWHSRHFHGALEEIQSHHSYHEIPGRGHWFEGIMQTSSLLSFYHDNIRQILRKAPRSRPDHFEVRSANPADTLSKNGIRIMSLQDPGRIGKLSVKITLFNDDTCLFDIKSSNVDRLRVGADACPYISRRISINGHMQEFDEFDIDLQHDSTQSRWKVGPPTQALPPRLHSF